ncbi:MAG: ATP-binding cassette domain-containing protein, partial [Deltaproteobacteria bacterium]
GGRGDEIVFDRVSFRYKERGPDVLQDVSFVVRPGEVVALVGATGSGKTTIGKLLVRLYDGYRGRITLGGVEISRIPLSTLRRRIALVHQDVFLFHDTIAFNIGLGRAEVSREAILEAARRVHLLPLLEEIPGGLDHVVSERGGNLSSGQAQLIALARLMAYDAPIVILDEATASVDSITEHLIQEGIREILTTKTVIVIAHRLSTIQQADRILVLHRGRIVEAGCHDELLERNGFYSRLCRMLDHTT